jgi:uncharacterized repeat protein (TIGR01451 family)
MTKAALPLAASLLALATAFTASAAHAAGVQAGTLIENTASASYDAGATTVTVQSNTVTVKVDELLDVAVVSLDTAPQGIGPTTAVLTFELTNTGNGPEAFTLTADPAVAGNSFNGAIQSLAIDTNGNGVYDTGLDQTVANGGSSGAVASDAKVTVFVIVAAPSGTPDAATSEVRLTAAASTGTGVPGTTFTGRGDGGGDAVVGVSTAQANATGNLVASLATVALTKSFAIADPFGGTQPVPGAVVTFTIQAAVSGSGSATDLHVTDGIPAGTSYKAGTLKLQGSALTDGADGDAGTASSSGIDVNLGSVAAGTTRTVTFSTQIN